MKHILPAFLWCLVLCAPASASPETWALIREPGHLVLMRHALAPGTGDPANFNVRDCATQRNLSEEGRAQARRTGEAFRRNGIDSATVYSSAWCRALDTAELLQLGEVEILENLNSFFGRGGGGAQIRALEAEIAEMTLDGPVVMVSHQVVVTGLTGVYPASGEMVVVRRTPSGLEVVGRIR